MQKINTVYKEFYTQGKYYQNYNFSSKDTVKRMKQLMGENIANHTFDKGLRSRLCKEFSKLNIKKMNNPIKNGQNRHNQVRQTYGK